jgi:hypothetical protein
MPRRQTLVTDHTTPTPPTLTPTLTLTLTPNLPAAPSNSFAAAANALPQPISYLKYNGQSGSWSRDGEPLDSNCRFFAKEPRYGHRYIQTGQPSEDYPEVVGKPFQDRKSLPHQDQSLWDLDDQGQPVDPVKQYISLALICLNDGRLCVYDALNPSSRRATTGIVNRIAWEGAAHAPLAGPLLQLGSVKVVNGIQQYFVPTFAIVSWVIQDQNGNWQLEHETGKPTTGQAIDDSIPW